MGVNLAALGLNPGNGKSNVLARNEAEAFKDDRDQWSDQECTSPC